MEKEHGKRVSGGKTKREPAEKRAKRPSRLTRQQKVLVVIAVLLAVALAAVAAVRSLFVEPELPIDKPNSQTDKPAIDYGEGSQPKAAGERKSDQWYTVLILGRDTGGGGNTDTMLLASYNVTDQKATVMSIPRDTMVNVPWDIKRINSVYNYYGGGDRGIQHLYKEISQLVGFEPDFQVVVEWEAVGQIVDAMGGVYFDVPRNMNYDDPYQDLHIHQEKGYRLLSGDDAMQVLRYRHDNNMKYGYPDGDLGRIKTQQAFLTAMVEQLLKLENLTKVQQFIKVFQDNVETDLSFQNILWFARSAYLGGLNMENVQFVTMPNKSVSCWSRSVGNMQSYVVPKAQELLDLVNTSLSPFVEPSAMRDLDIMSVNADGSVSSTTGHVEDSKAAQAPVKPQKPAPAPEEPAVDENGDPAEPGAAAPEGGATGGSGTGTEQGEPQTPPTAPPVSGPETPETPPEQPSTGDGSSGQGETGSVPAPPAVPEAPAVPEVSPEPETPDFSIIEPPPEGGAAR